MVEYDTGSRTPIYELYNNLIKKNNNVIPKNQMIKFRSENYSLIILIRYNLIDQHHNLKINFYN